MCTLLFVICTAILCVVLLTLLSSLEFGPNWSQKPAVNDICQYIHGKDFQHPVPMHIHQIQWSIPLNKTDDDLLQHQCQNTNPAYNYTQWTKQDIHRLLIKYYPWALTAYRAYKYPTQQIQIAAYFILYHYGGIYVGYHMKCNSSISSLLKNMSDTTDVILDGVVSLDVLNISFIAAKPHHPFMRSVVYSLGLPIDEGWYGVEPWAIIDSVGPLLLHRVYYDYLCKQYVHILSEHEYVQLFGGERPLNLSTVLNMYHKKMVDPLMMVIITFVCLAVLLASTCLKYSNDGDNIEGTASNHRPLCRSGTFWLVCIAIVLALFWLTGQ